MTGKTEVVIVGGILSFMPADYQRHFAKSCYDALNGEKSSTLRQAMACNETAENCRRIHRRDQARLLQGVTH